MSAAYALRSVGTSAHGQGALTAGAPAGRQVGDLLVLASVTRDSTTSLSPPTGFTLLSPSTNVPWNYLFGRIADGTSADLPSLTYSLDSGSAPHAWCQMAAFEGSVYGSIGSIVDVPNDKTLPGVQTTVNYAALTPLVANDLVIALGAKNKTTTSDGTAFNSLSGFTQLSQYVGSGTDVSVYWGYQQQTTATTITAASQTMTITETLQNASIMVSLLTATGASALPAAAALFLNQQDS